MTENDYINMLIELKLIMSKMQPTVNDYASEEFKEQAKEFVDWVTSEIEIWGELMGN